MDVVGLTWTNGWAHVWESDVLWRVREGVLDIVRLNEAEFMVADAFRLFELDVSLECVAPADTVPMSGERDSDDDREAVASTVGAVLVLEGDNICVTVLSIERVWLYVALKVADGDG